MLSIQFNLLEYSQTFGRCKPSSSNKQTYLTTCRIRNFPCVCGRTSTLLLSTLHSTSHSALPSCLNIFVCCACILNKCCFDTRGLNLHHSQSTGDSVWKFIIALPYCSLVLICICYVDVFTQACSSQALLQILRSA